MWEDCNEIKGMIRLLEPSSLAQPLKLARYYEQTLSTRSKKYSSYETSYKARTGTQLAAKTGIASSGGSSIGQTPLLIQNKT